jgi:hypothetical protein
VKLNALYVLPLLLYTFPDMQFMQEIPFMHMVLSGAAMDEKFKTHPPVFEHGVDPQVRPECQNALAPLLAQSVTLSYMQVPPGVPSTIQQAPKGTDIPLMVFL